jgi:glycosyltransferase involved in cell wall biosynthesis
MAPLRISIITNILPKYREGFYDALLGREDVTVRVYCQEAIPGTDFETIHHKYEHNVVLLRFVSASREKVAFQFVPWKKVLSESDVIFISGNPRVLSDVIFGTLLVLLKKKVVLWTMARSFRNNSLSRSIRLRWSRIFPYILVYTDEEADFLKERGFRNRNVLGINNGLNQKDIERAELKWKNGALDQWQRREGIEGLVLVLSCARLERKNRFELIAEALPVLISHIPNLLWCVIGSGPEMSALRARVSSLGVDRHVRFVGKLFDENDLAPWFMSSRLFIHPSAVGLSLLHAYGYGLPVIVSDNPGEHGPEYGAFKPGSTGLAFRRNDVASLAESIITLLCDDRARIEMGEKARSLARDKYNVEVMVDRFVRIAKDAFYRRPCGGPIVDE